MALVYGSGPNTGIEISEESTWGVASTGTYYTLAIVTDSFHVERDSFTDVEEFGSYGGRESIETGRAFSTGEFTVIPRYDSVAWNILLAHAMGAEDVVTTTHIDRSGTSETNGASHIYTFSSLPIGLTIRHYKSGDAPAGLREVYAGCIITGFTIEQPEGDVMKMTFRFLAAKAAPDQSGTLVTTGGGSRAFTARDLVYDSSTRKLVEIKTGSQTYDYPTASVGDVLPIRSFTVDVDKKVELGSNFITDPDTVDKPGITGTREVTLSLESYLERIATASTGYPYYEFLNNTNSAINIVFNDNLLVPSGTYPRGFRIDLPALTWETGEAPISDAGQINLSLTGRAYMTTYREGHATIPAAATPTELRLMTFVDGDDGGAGAGNSAYSSL